MLVKISGKALRIQGMEICSGENITFSESDIISAFISVEVCTRRFMKREPNMFAKRSEHNTVSGVRSVIFFHLGDVEFDARFGGWRSCEACSAIPVQLGDDGRDAEFGEFGGVLDRIIKRVHRYGQCPVGRGVSARGFGPPFLGLRCCEQG